MNFLKTFTTELETKLNTVSSNLRFALHADTGRYKRSYINKNKRNKPINGICSLISSEITPNVLGALVAAVTVRTEIVFQLPKTDENRVLMSDEGVIDSVEGSNSVLDSVRNALATICSTQTAETLIDGQSKSYSVSYAYEFVNTGNRMTRGLTGDSFTFAFNAYINIVEAGENSRDEIYYFDGQLVPYSTAFAVRKNAVDMDVYNGSYNAKATSTAGSLTFKLTCPSFIGKFNDAIKNYLANGESNVAHFLTCYFGSLSGWAILPERKTYLVMFDGTDRTAQGVLNVGVSITLVECVDDYELLSFGSAKITRINDVEGYDVTKTNNVLYFPYGGGLLTTVEPPEDIPLICYYFNTAESNRAPFIYTNGNVINTFMKVEIGGYKYLKTNVSVYSPANTILVYHAPYAVKANLET